MYIKIYLDPNDNSQYIVLRISLLKSTDIIVIIVYFIDHFLYFFPSSGSCGSLDPIHSKQTEKFAHIKFAKLKLKTTFHQTNCDKIWNVSIWVKII